MTLEDVRQALEQRAQFARVLEQRGNLEAKTLSVSARGRKTAVLFSAAALHFGQIAFQCRDLFGRLSCAGEPQVVEGARQYVHALDRFFAAKANIYVYLRRNPSILDVPQPIAEPTGTALAAPVASEGPSDLLKRIAAACARLRTATEELDQLAYRALTELVFVSKELE